IAQRERSRAAAEEIDAYIDDLQRKLSYLARVQGFSELPPDILQTFLEALTRHNTAYESVAATDNRGRLVSAVAPYGHGFENDLTDSLAFRRAYQEHEDFFSPVEFGPAIQVPLVTMAVPIRDMQDEIAGALVAKVNLGFLWFVVSKTEVGDSGYAYLVDDRRFLVVQKGDLPKTGVLEDLSKRRFIQELIVARGEPPVITYHGLRGTKVLGTSARIASVNWHVVVELPLSEAYAPVRRMLIFIGGTLVLAMLAALGLGLYFSGQAVLPLEKLTAASQRIQSGDFAVRVHVESGHELGMLATTFNTMTTRLQELIAGLERNVAEREKLIDELETKNTELERFTYTVSHDLKSPLITIKGFLGMLEQDVLAGDRERLETDIQYIANAADKMYHLLEDLLELSRIGRMVNPSEGIVLSELLHEALELVSGRISQKGVRVDVAPDLPAVYGDPIRIREVFENLIDNAVKYMGEQPEPHVEIGMRKDQDDRIFFVKDNGLGIESAYHDKVFDLFEQLNPNKEGTGVGLATVKRIIELHDGRIWVESEGMGKGTAFCFTLGKEKTQL
ncbi:MAG: sensor histidine kinase, partial [bacterium]|nr:sensor histidine kinase [bacterium]